jgi:hypothetical protein
VTERNRGRERSPQREHMRALAHCAEYELPDAPENPEFAQLFTPAQATEIDRRFQLGIDKGHINNAVASTRAKTASIACHIRFNKPKRPDRKQRALKAKLADIAHAPGRR